MTNVKERLDFQTTSDRFQLTLHRQRYQFVLAQFTRVESALEVGTGVGNFAPLLAERCDRYTGLEFDPAAAAEAAKRVGTAGQIVCGDARNLPFEPRTFDLVVCLEVLEHLGDWVAGLKGAQRCLKQDGLAVFSIPCRRRGGKSPTNPYHVYEPGEYEFLACLRSSFHEVQAYYQHFEETALMTVARRLRLRRALGLARLYQALSLGEPEAISRLKIEPKPRGLKLHLLAVARGPKPTAQAA
jgi:SAM-dependent methyltransferase